jgi:hypothetical protein
VGELADIGLGELLVSLQIAAVKLGTSLQVVAVKVAEFLRALVVE